MSASARALLPAICVALASCGGDGAPPGPDRSAPSPDPAELVRQARRFSKFPLYFAGRSFDGLDLVAAEPTYGRGAYIFVYGDCTVDAEDEDSACTPPLQLTVRPADRQPAPISGEPTRSFRRRGAVVVEGDGGATATVYTGSIAIVVEASPPPAARVVRALRPVGAKADPRKPLASPIRVE